MMRAEALHCDMSKGRGTGSSSARMRGESGRRNREIQQVYAMEETPSPSKKIP